MSVHSFGESSLAVAQSALASLNAAVALFIIPEAITDHQERLSKT
jgi:hypothetical protein